MIVICFDLDDTLSKEIAYLQSAYYEIAAFAAEHCSGCQTPLMVLEQKGYEVMMNAYQTGNNAFVALNNFLGLDLSISDYLAIYRNHIPAISLPEAIRSTLVRLQEADCILGIITDGRSVQQRNKIKALNLDKVILDSNIIISEEFGTEKPAEANYRYFMERYPDADLFVYVGDNPKKDFLAPNRLGWLTIGVKDNGENIHSQQLYYPEEYQPKKWIVDFSELLSLPGQKEKQ